MQFSCPVLGISHTHSSILASPTHGRPSRLAVQQTDADLVWAIHTQVSLLRLTRRGRPATIDAQRGQSATIDAQRGQPATISQRHYTCCSISASTHREVNLLPSTNREAILLPSTHREASFVRRLTHTKSIPPQWLTQMEARPL